MNLKNTKVYSLDKEVIRKYAKLCDADLVMDHKYYDDAVGYTYSRVRFTVDCFAKTSDVDTGYAELKTITPEEINAMYAEKFGQTETPEEKEVFEAMEREYEQPSAVEWDGEGLPPIGATCRYFVANKKKITQKTTTFEK